MRFWRTFAPNTKKRPTYAMPTFSRRLARRSVRTMASRRAQRDCQSSQCLNERICATALPLLSAISVAKNSGQAGSSALTRTPWQIVSKTEKQLTPFRCLINIYLIRSNYGNLDLDCSYIYKYGIGVRHRAGRCCLVSVRRRRVARARHLQGRLWLADRRVSHRGYCLGAFRSQIHPRILFTSARHET